MTEAVDAIVIGAGHNGLVAAATLADAGWDVLILEQQPEPGGAVRSAELFSGFVSDLFSAFYPLGAASPILEALDLGSHGLTWSHAPTVLGHPRSALDDVAPIISRDIEVTVARLQEFDRQDAQTWLHLCDEWKTLRPNLIRALLSPFPPVRAATQLWRAAGTAESLRLARFLTLPARRMSQELFRSEEARLLLLGNAMHADIPSDGSISGVMGYILAMLGQEFGFPVPVGGAGGLTKALVSRAESSGARLRCSEGVTAIEVAAGVAVGVQTEAGDVIRAKRAVIADVSAPDLYNYLLPRDALPARVRDDISKFEWDAPALKINYALRAPVPWRAEGLRGAGTIHLGADENDLVRWKCDLTTGVVPQKPFVVFGQMTTADATRSPAGTESAWAYTHLPTGRADDISSYQLADRVDRVLEDHAPGFRDLVIGRSVQTPRDLANEDANLHGGSIGGGTSQLHQQLVFRPIPGLARSETPVDRLYLGSASAHPGGGVHGACGHNAARAALLRSSKMRWPRRKMVGLTEGLLNRTG